MSARNQNDPRRDNAVLKYDKESITKITAEQNQGTSEFYQLISMFIGIYAFMMKVPTTTILNNTRIGQMGSVVQLVLLCDFPTQYAP